jgi:hypothetical protein
MAVGEDQIPEAAEPVDLKAEMGAVFDEMNKSAPEDAPVAAPSEPAGAPPAETPAAATGDRPRGPDGKFLKADKPVEPTPAAAPDEAAPVIDPAATPAVPTAASTVPKSWKSEQRDLFMKADPKLRDYIVQREGEMERGVAQLRERYAPIDQALAPIASEIAMRGLDPAGYIRSMIAADFALRQDGPQAIQAIARQYGIDLARLTQAPADAPPADPNFAAIQRELQTLRQQVQSQETNQSQALLRQTETLVDRFASDPANKFYQDVESDMLQMIPVVQRAMAGQPADAILKEAYQRAIWANPTVRAKQLAETTAEADRKRTEDAKIKAAEAARVAGTNLSSRSSPSGSPSKAKSQKDTLAEIYDAHTKAA